MNLISNISVIIITLNEESNLQALLATLPTGLEVIVVDSGSWDGTQKVAESYGAKFIVRKFDDYASQKNAALAMTTRNWVLSLDADEIPTSSLWREVMDAVSSGERTTAWRIRRRQIFLNKKLRFGKASDSPIRLFDREFGVFKGSIHEGVVLPKSIQVSCLKSELYHYSYKDITDYFSRFNRYTSSVAQKHFDKNKAPPGHWLQAARFFMEFVWRYLVRLGFLDGYPGFVYALFGSVYVFVKYAKLEELAIAKGNSVESSRNL